MTTPESRVNRPPGPDAAPSRAAGAGQSAALSLLLRLDRRRLGAALFRPNPGVWVGIGLPLLVLLALVWTAGSAAELRIVGSEQGVTLGVLISAPLAFLAYGTLFRGGDDAFLRRLGISAQALFRERALRLLGFGAGLVALVLVAFAASGTDLGAPLRVALAAVLAAWGSGAAALAFAARMMADQGPGARWGCLTAGMWDREVATAAPLVYAPLPALVLGTLAGGVAAAPEVGWVGVAVVAALAAVAARAAETAFVRALPRFAPRVLEMSFAPAPSGGAEMRVGRGVARLLPRAAAAVWARDAAVADRRFAWAVRVVWPVAVVSVVALARWGEQPEVRAWVAAAGLGVFVLQAAAILGLGRIERAGRRWIDRAAGVSTRLRFLGRWAWGWGLSLWLGVPLALAWGWWTGTGTGWPWLLVGGGTSAVAALASTVASGWR